VASLFHSSSPSISTGHLRRPAANMALRWKMRGGGADVVAKVVDPTGGLLSQHYRRQLHGLVDGAGWYDSERLFMSAPQRSRLAVRSRFPMVWASHQFTANARLRCLTSEAGCSINDETFCYVSTAYQRARGTTIIQLCALDEYQCTFLEVLLTCTTLSIKQAAPNRY